MYLPCVVTRYPHLPSLGYLNTSSSRLPSSVFPPYYSKISSGHRKKSRNRISNEQEKKIVDVVTIREVENQELLSVSVDGSHEEQVYHKNVSALLPQNISTVNLTATSDSKLFQWRPIMIRNMM